MPRTLSTVALVALTLGLAGCFAKPMPMSPPPPSTFGTAPAEQPERNSSLGVPTAVIMPSATPLPPPPPPTATPVPPIAGNRVAISDFAKVVFIDTSWENDGLVAIISSTMPENDASWQLANLDNTYYLKYADEEVVIITTDPNGYLVFEWKKGGFFAQATIMN